MPVIKLKERNKMWHEARRQEKKIRGLMVDYKKRAERRREYYEKIKLDPTQFLRVYGRPYKVHLDPTVAMAAESPQSMMPWQGHRDNMIDRFDVRAHLDSIPEHTSTKVILSRDEEDEERQSNYERYRTLVENEAAGLTEEQALHQIFIDEQFGPVDRTGEEEKKKLADKKAAIGYTYEDSTPVGEEEDEESDESSDTDVETADLDVTLDVDELTPEQTVMVNQCAELYGMKNDDFIRLLRKDKEELEALRQAKILEEEKAQFAGRKSRRERRAFKEKRLQGRKISPPSYAARDSPKYEPYKRSSSSSSRSRSRSPENVGKVLFITSFGDESEAEESGIMHGPSLPHQSRAHSDKSDSKHHSCGSKSKKYSSKRRSRSRSRSPSRSTSRNRKSRWRGRSSSRSRSRSRSRGYVSRERRYRPRPYGRSRSPYRYSDYRGHTQYGDRYKRWSRSLSRSPRRRQSRSASSSASSSSSRSRSGSYHSSSRSSSSSRSKSRSKSRSHSKSRSWSRSRSPSKPAVAPAIKRYRRVSMSSKSSEGDSDMEEENGHGRAKEKSPVKRSKMSKLPGKMGLINQVSKNLLTRPYTSFPLHHLVQEENFFS